MDWFKKVFSSEPAKDAPKQNDAPAGGDPGRPSVLGNLIASLSLGTDVLRSGLSLPILLHEPMTQLQRSAEMLATAPLLMTATQAKDPQSRMAFVTAFGITGFVGTERLYSDFNPILGETYEWIDPTTGFKFLAEQVSHHPPISAVHAENQDIVFWQNYSAKAQFLGNSVDVDTQCRTQIYFQNSKDHFYYSNPCIRIHNLILGSMWLEHHGELNIKNLKTGDTSVVVFKKCGFFEDVRYDVEGYVKDAAGNSIIHVYGEWNKYVSAKWLVDTPTFPKNHVEEIWKLPAGNFIGGRYNFTKYASTVLEVDEEHFEALLPPSDSRLRLDRRALAIAEYDKAATYKRMLEERQRADRREREAKEGHNEWSPVWFQKIPDEDGGHTYVYCGNYWSQREQKKAKLKAGEDVGSLTRPAQVVGTATDFTSYGIAFGPNGSFNVQQNVQAGGAQPAPTASTATAAPQAAH